MTAGAGSRTTGYEWRAVTCLALGFGLVGLDRWLIAPLIPSIARDLHLDGQDVGNVLGVLGLSWGIFAIFLGQLADHAGRRAVLIPSLIVFSLTCGLTGAVTSLQQLLVIRAVMGATEGAYIAAAVAATADASHPNRRGLNQGLMLSMFPLLGFGLGPVLATSIEAAFGSWREVFYFAAVPGLVMAAVLFAVLKEPRDLGLPTAPRSGAVSQQVFRALASATTLVVAGYLILQTRNMPLILGIFGCALIGMLIAGYRMLRSRNMVVAMASLVCAMSCIFVLGGFYPDYLQRHLHVSPVEAGLLMTSLGFGGWAGEVLSGVVSDFIGRKATTVASFVGAALAVTALIGLGEQFTPDHAQLASSSSSAVDMGGQFWAFYAALSLVSLFTFGVLTIMTGPVPSESAPPTMVAAAVGFASGTGEIFGAGVGPPLAGFVSDTYGIANVLYVGLVGLVLGTVLTLFLKETAPRLRR
jgi:MFS family permease